MYNVLLTGPHGVFTGPLEALLVHVQTHLKHPDMKSTKFKMRDVFSTVIQGARWVPKWPKRGHVLG